MRHSRVGSIKQFLPIIIGILLSVPLAFAAFFLFQEVMTRASSEEPVQVRVSEITDTTAVISWVTDQETMGTVEYGTSPEQLGSFAPEASMKSTHLVELSLLDPRTTYYFVIRINNRVYTDEGVPWKFTTKGPGESATEPTVEVVQEKKLRVPTPRGGGVCPKTDDCASIRELIGSGCTTQDFVQCQRLNGAVQGASTQRNTRDAFPSPTPVRKIDATAKDRAVPVSPRPPSKGTPTYVPPDTIR
ncbi:MAG: hypothetical protein N2691_02775 [Patescibacteria group bacterium]|nr:hypothetical protein [Patescibacteria group bacterium]